MLYTQCNNLIIKTFFQLSNLWKYSMVTKSWDWYTILYYEIYETIILFWIINYTRKIELKSFCIKICYLQCKLLVHVWLTMQFVKYYKYSTVNNGLHFKCLHTGVCLYRNIPLNLFMYFHFFVSVMHINFDYERKNYYRYLSRIMPREESQYLWL